MDLRTRFALTYPMVADPDLSIAAAYGVRQEGRELALPATFVVGANGRVAWVKVARHPVDRPAIDDLLALLARVRAAR